MSPDSVSPLEEHNGVFLKREDKFQLHGACGGKLRQALAILRETDADGIIGCGGRRSNTAASMAAAAKELKRICVFHTASGMETAEMSLAERIGGKVLRHAPGYMGVLRARAREYSESTCWPVGLLHPAAIRAVKMQVVNLINVPFKRLVVPVGAGVTLMGILYGLKDFAIRAPVLAITVGGAPDSSVADVAAAMAADGIHVSYAQSKMKYENPCLDRLGSVGLDPYYESKCIPFLEEGDLLWVAGNRTPPSLSPPPAAGRPSTSTRPSACLR